MAKNKPIFYARPEAIANAIIENVGKQIFLALPLGLGKANLVANALVQRAKENSTIK